MFSSIRIRLTAFVAAAALLVPVAAPAHPGHDDVAALYAAGLHDGAFDVERLFDTLFSPAVHGHAMVAVGRKYGAGGETAYHVVFARLVQDLAKPERG